MAAISTLPRHSLIRVLYLEHAGKCSLEARLFFLLQQAEVTKYEAHSLQPRGGTFKNQGLGLLEKDVPTGRSMSETVFWAVPSGLDQVEMLSHRADCCAEWRRSSREDSCSMWNPLEKCVARPPKSNCHLRPPHRMKLYSCWTATKDLGERNSDPHFIAIQHN